MGSTKNRDRSLRFVPAETQWYLTFSAVQSGYQSAPPIPALITETSALTDPIAEPDEIKLSVPLIRLESAPIPGGREAVRGWKARRDRWVREHRVTLSTSKAVPARLPATLSFAQLPFDLLLAYQQHREASELGQVFRIANGLHDHIDALVVIGNAADCQAARMLVQACCDPYHNELSRACRGSKPRLYFVTDPVDNDQVQSLLARLTAGGYGSVPAERRWGLIWVRSSAAAVAASETRSDRSLALFRVFFEQLTQHADWRHSNDRPALITCVGDSDPLRLTSSQWPRITQRLRAPMNLAHSPLGVFGPLSLLVGALLGLDCVQYLVGAVAVTQNFLSAETAKNLVLRYAAANRFGLAVDRSCRLTTVSTRTLLPVADWMSATDRWWGDHNTRAATAAVGSLRGGKAVADGLLPPMVVNHVSVDAVRTDRLFVPERQHVGSLGGATLPAIAAEEEGLWRDESAAAGAIRSVVHLPLIDTAWLGQLFQLHLLARSLAASVGRPESDRV